MHANIVIVGGGIIGSSIAYHLASAGRAGDIVVVERDPSYEHASTPRSNGGIRRLFSLPENILMASYGLDFYRDFHSTMAIDGEPADINFQRQGYLFISDSGGATQMQANFDRQHSMGVDAELLSPDALKTRFPSLAIDGVDLAVLSSNDAWIDPQGALMGLRRKARALGVTYINGEVEALRADDVAVRDARCTDGTIISGDIFVNACGAWCAALAATVGLTLPVEPMSRESYYWRCEQELESLPFVKTESDLAIRPEGAGYVGGVPDWSQRPGWDFEIAPAYFETIVWPALAKRIPAMESLRLERSWRGHYERSSLDYSPFIGRCGGRLDNFILANGFSGHGIMHAPAAGRAVTELILNNGYTSIDLSCFSYQRIRDNKPYRELGIV